MNLKPSFKLDSQKAVLILTIALLMLIILFLAHPILLSL